MGGKMTPERLAKTAKLEIEIKGDTVPVLLQTGSIVAPEFAKKYGKELLEKINESR